MTQALLASQTNTMKSCPFSTAQGPSVTFSPPFFIPLTSLLCSKTEMSQPSASTHVLVDALSLPIAASWTNIAAP